MVNKQKQKGFTLVELIVVLVILGVLAALLVPALTGYIEKARKKAVIADTRAITQAAQTELSMVYATDEYQNNKSTIAFTVASKNNAPFTTTYPVVLNGANARYNDIVSLSEVASLQGGKGGRFSVWADHSGVILFTVYYDGKGYVGVYCAEDGAIEALDVDKDKVDITSYFDGSGGYSYGDKLIVQKAPAFSMTAREALYYGYLGMPQPTP